MTDTRIAFGAFCTWWGPIAEAGKANAGPAGHRLPCCPFCGSPLYEEPDRAAWDRRLAGVPTDRFPDYAATMQWQHDTGRPCERSFDRLRNAYQKEKPTMGTCENCPLRYRHDETPPEGTRSHCDCEIEKLRQEKAAGAARAAPSNMMVNDIGQPVRAPLNRAERRRQEAQQRRRTH